MGHSNLCQEKILPNILGEDTLEYLFIPEDNFSTGDKVKVLYWLRVNCLACKLRRANIIPFLVDWHQTQVISSLGLSWLSHKNWIRCCYLMTFLLVLTTVVPKRQQSLTAVVSVMCRSRKCCMIGLNAATL